MNVKLISYSKPFEKMEGVEDAKTSLRIAPVFPIHRIKPTKKRQKSSYVILSKTNIGRPLKWLALA